MKYFALCHMQKSGHLKCFPLGNFSGAREFDASEKEAKRLCETNRDILTVVWVMDEGDIKSIKQSLKL
jgi:hypothetical protein